jgi:tetratricopeptide (TPR) repeat protein
MLGVLAGKTGNLVGSWNNLSILSLCGIILALLLIECAYITKKHKILLTLFVIISLFITLLTNFPLTWELLTLFSAFIFTYRVYLYRKQTIFSLHTQTAFPTHSLFVLIISLLFFVSGQFIGSYIPTKLGITNLEASPTFISTMGVLNGVLEQNPFTGMGPNNFAEAWARYKSPLVNSSSYWNIAFNTGSGLIPTFFITTGLFGVLALCTFFYFLYVPYKKKIFEKMLSREHTEVTILYMVTLCLSLASFLYTIGTTLFFLLFASLGVMIGASTFPHKGERITFSFLNDPRYSFFGMAVLVSLIVCSVSFAGFYTKRFISVSYFTKTLEATNTQDARGSISRAVELYPTDLYYRTYAQVELFTLKEILEKTKREGFGEESTASLKQSSDSALRLAESAVRFHPRNALNWEILGMVYESLSNVGLYHAYDKAIESYRMASALDPLNPRMKLIIANTLATEGKYEEAKNVVREALQLKQGYKDALGLLSQIEYAEKNSSLSPSK